MLLAVLLALCAFACSDPPKKPLARQPAAACAHDAECARGRCDPFAGCVECLFDGDCGADARCVEQTCHAVVACASDDECDSGACDLDLGRCAECRSSADCAANQRCSDAVCVGFAPCARDADCDETEVCSDAGQCAMCASDTDCADGFACSGSKCVARCDSNEDCPAVYHCTRATCALDVCEAGTSSCSVMGNATTLCSAAGDSSELSPCGKGRTCSSSAGVATCEPSACAPATWSCDETRKQAELCSADGLEVVRTKDCAVDGLICDGGECVERICEPGVVRCDGHATATCNDSGSNEAKSPCADGERCDTDSATCVAQICEPGSAGCIEETIGQCNEEGSGYEVAGDDCAASGLACWQGACLPVACGAGFSCIEGDSYECTANRTELTLAESCAFEGGRFCAPESGQCQAFACEPGQPTCNEDLATRCANDGSHPLDIGIDCTATNKLCWAAQCLPNICEEGGYACAGAELRRCVHKGTAFEPSKICGPGTVCDAAAGTCRLQKCVANEPACDGSLATTCDGTGLGFVGDATDCAANDEVCVEGACLPVVCEAGSVYCASNEVRACAPTGTSFEVIDACLQAEFCDVTLGACTPLVCSPNAPACAGNMLSTCKSDGSGPQLGGTDCGNQVCEDGACRTLVCVPNARFCNSGDVALCNSTGTDSSPYDHCRPREFCDATAAGAAKCSADVCPQSAPACSGEQLATCNGDGSGMATVGTDCSSSSKVCDLSGTCSLEALDQTGGGGAALPFAGSAIHFNLFHVLTARKVVELEAGAEPVSSPATWIIYRSETEFGFYSRMDQISSPTSSSGGYASSGAISVNFESPAYYLIGLAVTGAHDISVQEAASPAPTSFGVWLGGYSYVAGLPPTIPNEVNVGPGLVGDALALRVHSALP